MRSGRGAVYSNVHLRLLDRIKALQAKGMTLSEVAFALSPGPARRELAEPVAWLEYELSNDVMVRVRSGIAPWRHKTIRKVLAEAAAKLQEEQKEKEKE
jgi:DNA-binding transcriptional MerR regulator